MKLKVWFATALLLVCAASAIAQDAQKAPAPAGAVPPTPSAEEKAMMETWMKAMTPGEGHKLLGNMAGEWNVTVTSWMAPGAPPMSSTGTASNQWVLGGRAMEERFTGSFMGQPFHGIGYTGYDNSRKLYWGTWMDNMSTGVMTSTGSTSDNGKTWKFTATMTDPMTGKETTSEERITVADADHHTMEMWGSGPDGKVFKMMEIVYSRKK